MCIAIPMQVISAEPGAALCRGRDGKHRVDTSLVGTPMPGTWLMVFLGAAREVISAETAQKSIDALEALDRVMRGDTDIDHLFADLIDREPRLPEHLRPANLHPGTAE